MSKIPTKTRELITERDLNRCIRCSARATETQHRRRRREGKHPASNLVRMCQTCHQIWGHRNPAEAMKVGIIVPTWADPLEVPIKTWRGWMLLDDEGGIKPLSSSQAYERLKDVLGDLV